MGGKGGAGQAVLMPLLVVTATAAMLAGTVPHSCALLDSTRSVSAVSVLHCAGTVEMKPVPCRLSCLSAVRVL
jgi:hypothetical protein